jgi:phage terminase small subunit
MNIDIVRDKLTPRQIKFCLLFVEHGDEMSARECAIQAGYAESVATKTASELRKKPHVAEYIRELRNKEEKKYEVNLHRHLKRLDQLSKGAEEKGNWNAAVQAEKSRGQVAGLYIDRKEIMHGSIDQLNREEVDKLLTDMDKKLSIEGSYKVLDDDKTRDEILEKDKE